MIYLEDKGMRKIAAGEFKAKCLAIMDEVSATGEPVLVTKRGKPVARVTAPTEPISRKIDVNSIFGSLRGMVTVAGDAGDLVGPIVPVNEWDYLKPDWGTEPHK
jgi:prevent-host-death family protein